MSEHTPTDLAWTAPGPGRWELLADHWPAPVTRWMQRAMPAGQEPGVRRMMARYGIPADTMAARFVNGYLYVRLLPIGREAPSKKAPPAALVKLLFRVHPELRRRTKAASRTMVERPWRAESAHWFDVDRERWRQRNVALQSVDPATLDDAALADHVRSAYEHVVAGCDRHFELHGADMAPIALLAVEAQRSGISALEMLSVLEGASPATSSVLDPLQRLADALDAAGADPATLDDVRAVSPEAAALLDGYLAERAWCVVTGYDVDDLTLGELPEAVLGAVAHARVARRSAARDEAAVAERVAGLRARVPEARRARFDELVADARLTHGLRDDNGPILVEWPVGLLRRALLEVGARLAGHGALADPAHVFELDEGEVARLLTGNGSPSPDEVAARAKTRARCGAATPPRTLGPEEPAPPLSALPAELAELLQGVQMVTALLSSDPAAAAGEGAGIGAATYVGRARVARTAEEALAAIEPGDVLVVPFTTPTYNTVLGVVGGLIVEEGGPLSHAAVIARELGIPAVIGVCRATATIPDGSMVEVDPVAGRCRVVAAPARATAAEPEPIG